MSTILKNEVSVNFMVWETFPELRKYNKKLNFVTDKEVKEGDVLVGNYGEGGVSKWVIAKINSSRPSSIKGKTYYETLAEWRNVGPMEFKNLDLQHCGKFFQDFIRDYKILEKSK